MHNNSLVLEFTAIPCSDTTLVDIPTVLQKLVFRWARPVNVASTYALRPWVKAVLFIHGYSCCLPRVGICLSITVVTGVQYLIKDNWPLGMFLTLDLSSHLISRSAVPLKPPRHI